MRQERGTGSSRRGKACSLGRKVGKRQQGGAAWSAVALGGRDVELRTVRPNVEQNPPIVAAQRLLTLAARPDRVLCRDAEKQVGTIDTVHMASCVFHGLLGCCTVGMRSEKVEQQVCTIGLVPMDVCVLCDFWSYAWPGCGD
jgi:hypothetical protein